MFIHRVVQDYFCDLVDDFDQDSAQETGAAVTAPRARPSQTTTPASIVADDCPAPSRTMDGESPFALKVIAAILVVTTAVLAGLTMTQESIEANYGVASTADGSTGCQLRVSAAEVRVRSNPSTDADQIGVLSEGVVVDGTPAVQDGFRELESGGWAADQYLEPLPGTDCCNMARDLLASVAVRYRPEVDARRTILAPYDWPRSPSIRPACPRAGGTGS